MAVAAGRLLGPGGRRGADGTPCAREAGAKGHRATLPAVTARSEVPSSFRSSSVRPGPLALIRLGITETLSRRRLIAYLVRADLKKSAARTRCWATSGGWSTRSSRWSSTGCWSGVILGRDSTEDYPLFIFAAILPWKWLDSTIKDGDPRWSARSG